jgi:hypothetical protein
MQSNRNLKANCESWLIGISTVAVPALVASAFFIGAAGCGTSLSPSTASSSAGTTQAQSQPPVGAQIGYVWDAASQSLRPLQGVAGAAIVGPAAVAAPAQGPGYISVASSAVSGWALFLDAAGGVYQSPLSGGTATRIALLPGATSLVLSHSGAYALVMGKSSSGAAFAASVSGLPGSPSVRSLNVATLPAIVGGAASDTGTVALASGSASGGVSVVAFVGQGAGTQVGTLQSFGGVQFAPGSDELVVADGGSGAVTAISHVNTNPSSAVVSAAGGIAAPVGLDITSNGRWVVAASAKGDVLRIDLSGASTPALAHCSCAPSQVAALSGNTMHLVTAGAGPLWIVDAGSSAPRVLFVPAIGAASAAVASKNAL